MRIVDLTFPVGPHFRWPFEHRLLRAFERGDAFQITWIGMGVHGFTHVDAPRHILPDGPTTAGSPLEATVGDALVVDLRDVDEDQPIDATLLARRADALRQGDIALLCTGWDARRSIDRAEYWTRAPWLTRDACEWLLERAIRALGVDFPQDRPIRGLLTGETAPMAEFVSHDVLLRNGIVLIEYLCNLTALPGPRVTFLALPLKLRDADGAPARAVALL